VDVLRFKDDCGPHLVVNQTLGEPLWFAADLKRSLIGRTACGGATRNAGQLIPFSAKTRNLIRTGRPPPQRDEQHRVPEAKKPVGA